MPALATWSLPTTTASVVVPRLLAETVLKQSKAREAKDATTRPGPARLKAGELGLDINGIRDKLRQKGLVYQHYESEA